MGSNSPDSPVNNWALPGSGLALLAGALWLSGLSWGLPSRDRLLMLMPAAQADSPQLHRELARGRTRLYAGLEARDRQPGDYIERVERIPGGWSIPPERLRNSFRSYFLRTANADEQKPLTYLAHMKPRRLDFEPFGIDYGGAYIYPLGAYFAVLKTAGLVQVSSDLTLYLRNAGAMARVFLAGRLFSCAGLLGCVLMLFLLGQGGVGRPAAPGWTAALLFALSPVVCVTAHTMNAYGWATFWFLTACWRMQAHLEDGCKSSILQAGAAAGLCVGSSFAFWTAAIPLLAPLLPRKGRPYEWKEALFLSAAAGAACGVVFVAANPYFFLRFEKFTGQLVFIARAVPFDFSTGMLWQFLTEFMPINWGWLQTAAGLFAAGCLLSRPDSEPLERVLAAAFWFSLVNLAGRIADFSHGRHFLPFFAVGSLAFARLLWGRVAPRSRALAITIAALVAVDAGLGAASYAANFRREAAGAGTRTAASRWMAENVPARSSVGLMQPPQYSETPPFRFDRHEIVLFAEPEQLDGERLPDFVLANEERTLHHRAAFFETEYEVAAAFRPKRLLPWVPVRGLLSMSNLEFVVLKKREDPSP